MTTPSSHASSSSFTTNRQLQLSNEFSTCTQQRRWPLRCLLARSEGILARLGILAGAKEFDRHIYADGFVSFSNSDLVYSGLSSPQAAQCIFPCCAFFRRFLKIIFHVFFFFLVFWSFFGNGDEIFSMSQRPTFDGFVLVSYFYLFRFALSVTKLASTAFAAPLSQRSRRRC